MTLCDISAETHSKPFCVEGWRISHVSLGGKMQKCKIQIEVPMCSELKLGIGQDCEHEEKGKQSSKPEKSDLSQLLPLALRRQGITTAHF